MLRSNFYLNIQCTSVRDFRGLSFFSTEFLIKRKNLFFSGHFFKTVAMICPYTNNSIVLQSLIARCHDMHVKEKDSLQTTNSTAISVTARRHDSVGAPRAAPLAQNS